MAVAIAEEDIQQILVPDWQRLCIRTRLGMDPRTAKNWLEVALAEELLAPLRRSIAGGMLYRRGAAFDRILNNGHGGEGI